MYSVFAAQVHVGEKNKKQKTVNRTRDSAADRQGEADLAPEYDVEW